MGHRGCRVQPPKMNATRRIQARMAPTPSCRRLTRSRTGLRRAVQGPCRVALGYRRGLCRVAKALQGCTGLYRVPDSGGPPKNNK